MEFYLTLCAFCVSTSVTPGPNNLMIMMSGINHGIRNSIPHYLGICFGFCLMLLIIGLGFGELIKNYPTLYNGIKISGSVYMLYLACKIIFSSTKLNLNLDNNSRIGFIQAVVFQWANPKALVTAIGVFATFASTNSNMLHQVLLITSIYALVVFPSIAIWLFGGAALKQTIRNEKHLRVFNIIMGLLLIISIIFILT